MIFKEQMTLDLSICCINLRRKKNHLKFNLKFLISVTVIGVTAPTDGTMLS